MQTCCHYFCKDTSYCSRSSSSLFFEAGDSNLTPVITLSAYWCLPSPACHPLKPHCLAYAPTQESTTESALLLRIFGWHHINAELRVCASHLGFCRGQTHVISFQMPLDILRCLSSSKLTRWCGAYSQVVVDTVLCQFSQVWHAAILTFDTTFSIYFFQFCRGRPAELSAMRFNSAIFLALPAGCLFWSVEQRKCCQVESGNKWQWGNWKVIKKTILLERVTLFPKGFVKAIQLDTSRKRLDYANFLAGCRHVADLSLTLQTSRLSWDSSLFYVRTCPHLFFFSFYCLSSLTSAVSGICLTFLLHFFLFNMTA